MKDCSESEPMDPGPGSSPEELYDYNNEWGVWANSCIAELNPKLPTEPPNTNVESDKFEDNNGYVWTRTNSSKGVDFKLDFFNTPMKLKSLLLSNSKDLLIIGIRISLNYYSILTLGLDGIKMQAIKRNKLRCVNLLSIISNHVKIPNVDLEKIPNTFWVKHK